jgi:hypothetical protein
MLVYIDKKPQHELDHCPFGADIIPYIRKLIPVFSVYMDLPPVRTDLLNHQFKNRR